MDYKIDNFKKYNDVRGQLVVFLQNKELKKSDQKFGQIYFVTFKKKGIVRGNHYHKKWREWFGIVSGRVEVILEDVVTKERVVLKINANQGKYVRLEIGPNIAHAFKSLTKFAALLNYANGEWAANDDFTYKLI